MTYNLFIDDERVPSDVKWMNHQEQADYRNLDWVIARNQNEVEYLIENRGFPEKISFDHDLGDETNGTGYSIAKYLVNLDLDTDYKMPENFIFYVHSKNPIGKVNIENYLNSYMKQR